MCARLSWPHFQLFSPWKFNLVSQQNSTVPGYMSYRVTSCYSAKTILHHVRGIARVCAFLVVINIHLLDCDLFVCSSAAVRTEAKLWKRSSVGLEYSSRLRRWRTETWTSCDPLCQCRKYLPCPCLCSSFTRELVMLKIRNSCGIEISLRKLNYNFSWLQVLIVYSLREVTGLCYLQLVPLFEDLFFIRALVISILHFHCIYNLWFVDSMISALLSN